MCNCRERLIESAICFFGLLSDSECWNKGNVKVWIRQKVFYLPSAALFPKKCVEGLYVSMKLCIFARYLHNVKFNI